MRVGLCLIIIFNILLLVSCSSQSAETTKRNDASVTVELANLYRDDGYNEGEYNTLMSYVTQYSDIADSQVSYNLALYYYDNKQYEKAIELCNKNYEVYKAHTRFLKLIYRCYLELEDFENAGEYCNKLVEIGDFDENEVTTICDLYDKIDRKDFKKSIINKCFDKGLFSKKIIDIAISLDSDNPEYKILSLYAK